MSTLQIQKTPHDYQRIVNENMNFLKMQANLEQQYYNANKILQVTGMLQDPTPPDMRSESDRFAIGEQTRQQFRTQLMTITNGTNADLIVNDFSVSDIPRILQGWPIISKYCKENYVYGIPAKAFATYIKETFLPDIDVASMVSIGNSYLISTIQDIVATTPTESDVLALKKAYEDSYLPNADKAAAVTAIDTILADLIAFRTELVALAKETPEKQGQMIFQINRAILDKKLIKNQILEMTRAQQTANALGARDLDFERYRTLAQAAALADEEARRRRIAGSRISEVFGRITRSKAAAAAATKSAAAVPVGGAHAGGAGTGPPLVAAATAAALGAIG
jgi:hypothetical protein